MIASTRQKAETRWVTCLQCPAYRPALSRCAHCGYLLMQMVWDPSASCPEGRW